MLIIAIDGGGSLRTRDVTIFLWNLKPQKIQCDRIPDDGDFTNSDWRICIERSRISTLSMHYWNFQRVTSQNTMPYPNSRVLHTRSILRQIFFLHDVITTIVQADHRNGLLLVYCQSTHATDCEQRMAVWTLLIVLLTFLANFSFYIRQFGP